MTAGYWVNQDGLLLNYGVQKAVPEVGGDFLAYGETRLIETYISLAPTTFGQAQNVPVSIAGVPQGFTSNNTPNGPTSAGIVSETTMFPLQVTAPQNTGSSGLGVALTQTQLWIDRVEVECLITANAGTGGATGLTGVGLVVWNPTSQVYVQVTPNAGTQLLGAMTNAQMTAGNKWTFWPVSASGAMTAFPTSTPPTGGNWGGAVPLVTNSISIPVLASPSNPNGLPEWAYISAVATGGTYSGTTAAGLLKLRVFYNMYGNIAN
jgi:hypothetical protein